MDDASRLVLMRRGYALERAPSRRDELDQGLWELTSRPEPAQDKASALARLRIGSSLWHDRVREEQAQDAATILLRPRSQSKHGRRRNLALETSILSLRAEGLTYDRISERLGVSRNVTIAYAHRAFKRELRA